jgi:hypothetical protein
MPMCEKCWVAAYDPNGNQSERYLELVKVSHCTPEEQAGTDAGYCPMCKRQTVHQYAQACMVCGWRLR